MSLSLSDVYDAPSWILGTLIVTVFIAFAVVGQIVVRHFLVRWYAGRNYNETVGQCLAASGVFFGITLGLLAVGAWENFSTVDEAVTQEASNLGVLYRMVNTYPEPHRQALIGAVRDYTRREIEIAWPQMRQGLVPSLAGKNRFEDILLLLTRFEPATEGQKIVHGETLRLFNQLGIERRKRISSVTTELPPIVWAVVFGGSILTLATMWLFVVENKRLHDLLTGMLAAMLGLLVFLLAVMDYPFRGDYSIGPEAFEQVYERFMR